MNDTISELCRRNPPISADSYISSFITHDQLDALTSAFVGKFDLAGKYEVIGNDKEGYLTLPNFQALIPG
ncbi:MAG: hypothetical protein STSR0009_00040 [Methanoregula sp.]